MLCMTIVLEDGVLHAAWSTDHWDVVIGDNVTGKEYRAPWTSRELGAMLELAIAGEDIVEPLFAPPCPSKCRLIP